ncbi:MAG TPA: WhiB family transcriptional regulator [Candidatus Saccharimonadales bacterium]
MPDIKFSDTPRCEGMDRAIFTPASPDFDLQAARAICDASVIKDECFEASFIGVVGEVRSMVWGGFLEHERQFVDLVRDGVVTARRVA